MRKSTPSAMSLLRITVGIVYLWFGALKFFQGLSPAEQLAMQTIHELTVSKNVARPLRTDWWRGPDHLNILFLAA